MVSIHDVMTSDHKRCDQYFAEAEQCVMNNDWQNAIEWAGKFNISLLQHFDQEEQKLFPAFEKATGMTEGPTQMMRHEHQQMRELLKALTKSVEDENRERFIGISETLHIFMQQHNMKEEQVLYPMIEQHCNHEAEILLTGLAISPA